MFGQLGLTEFDLRFNCFGIPVRVTPWFWLVGLFTARHWIEQSMLDYAFIWVMCLFVSILIHEMGHALAANFFGWPPEVYLYHFGGLAVFQPYHGYTTWRSVFVSFAGPLAGFLFFGLATSVFVGREFFSDEPPSEYWLTIFADITLINLFWGFVNLVPVLPLDGGQISRALFDRFRPRDGIDWTLRVGIVSSLLTAMFFVKISGLSFPTVLFGILFIQNLQMYQQSRGTW